MKRIIVISFAIMLSGCLLGTPIADTNNKRLASVEITWKHTLELIGVNAARFSDSQRSTLRKELPKIENAIKAAHLALDLSDTVSFENNVSTINSGLSVLRSILETLEETSNENFKRHYTFGFGHGWLRDKYGNRDTVSCSGIRRPECYSGTAQSFA